MAFDDHSIDEYPADQYSVPKGWMWTVLGDVCKVERGITFPAEAKQTEPHPGHIICLRTSNVQEVTDWDDLIYVPKNYVKSESKIIRENDILISMANSRDLVGKTSFIGQVKETCTFGGFISVIRTFAGIEPRFLFYHLRESKTREWLKEASSQTVNIANLSLGRIAPLPVTLAPLNEQRRIVEAIEALFSRLDAGIAALKRAQANLKRYKASVLKAACEGQLVPQDPDDEPASELLARILAERRAKWEAEELAKYEAKGKKPPKNWCDRYPEPQPPDTSDLPELPEGWVWASVEQLTTTGRPCAYGVLQPGPDLPDGVPLVRVSDIDDGSVSLEGMKRIDPLIAGEYQRTQLRGGEVLITLVGSIGRTAVVPEILSGANTARAVGVMPIVDLVYPYWVEIWFRNPSKVTEMTGKAHEVARKTLNLEDVRSATIGLPPADEQKRIVNEVNRFWSVIEEVETDINYSLKRAEGLRQSILKEAFAGRLVPQDPDDEPASALLERIRVEREQRR